MWDRVRDRTPSSPCGLDHGRRFVARGHRSGQATIRNDPRVRFVVADIFKWEPPQTYDVVFFRAWLTLVPPTRFESFWHLVNRALEPGGRVFFDDDLEGAFEEQPLDEPHLVRRTIETGEEFRVVKRFWRLDELESTLRTLGWDIRIRSTGLLCGERVDARRSSVAISFSQVRSVCSVTRIPAH